MKKNKSKNASSFWQLSEIERGQVINKIKLPSNSFERFSFSKTDIFKVDSQEIFIIKPEASKILDLKIGRK